MCISRNIKLAVFDFDGTLMDGESIGFLAQAVGRQEEVDYITAEAMEGRMDFFESLKRRVKLLEGMKVDLAREILASLPLMPHAKEFIARLKGRGVICVCFSGGFSWGVDAAAEKLLLDAGFANVLQHKNGLLTGEVGGEMMFNDSKGRMMQSLQKILKITPQETLCAGDGANDISMFKHAGIRIAFYPKEALKPYATHIINSKDWASAFSLFA